VKWWVTSDQHWGHANIIKYTGRTVFMNPSEVEKYHEIVKMTNKHKCDVAMQEFKISSSSLKSMNETMTRKWNSVVNNDDIVIHCGDFSLVPRHIRQKYRQNLNGTIILIKGSHDDSLSRLSGDGFIAVEGPLYIDNIAFSHEPMEIVPFGFVNVHGHIHDKKTTDRRINVSVEQTDFCPVTLSSLRKEIKKNKW